MDNSALSNKEEKYTNDSISINEIGKTNEELVVSINLKENLFKENEITISEMDKKTSSSFFKDSDGFKKFENNLKSYESVIKPTNSFNIKSDIKINKKDSIIYSSGINLHPGNSKFSTIYSYNDYNNQLPRINFTNNYHNNININFINNFSHKDKEDYKIFKPKRDFNSKLIDVFNELNSKPTKKGKDKEITTPEEDFDKFYNEFKTKKIKTQKQNFDQEAKLNMPLNTNIKNKVKFNKLEMLINSGYNIGSDSHFNLKDEMIDLGDEINNFKKKFRKENTKEEPLEIKDNSINFEEEFRIHENENEDWNKIIKDDQLEYSPVKEK